MRFQILVFSVILLLSGSIAEAGGLLGDIVNRVVPGAGTRLDDAHRQIKNAIPPYKALEEGASHAVNETFVQAGAPALIELIARSRDDALRQGVQPIPPDIRANLVGFIPENILNVVRFRVQGGGDLTLQVNSIRYGEAAAVALDYVVVFKEQNDALFNPTLWAHELTHIAQYQRWGIRDFAIRYLRSYQSVESEAYEAETRYAAWVATRNVAQSNSTDGSVSPSIMNRPASSFSSGAVSNICGTAAGMCALSGAAPAGTPCWCGTFAGPAVGSIIPGIQAQQISTPVGLPSNYVMTPCGCYGPMAPQTAPEPRCMSQFVRLNMCSAFCQGGGQAYGYTCN